MKISKTLIYLFIIVLLIAGAYFAWIYFCAPKEGWKRLVGCVSQGENVVNYSFFARDEWEPITPNMGCGKDYEGAETFGLLDQNIGGQVENISQIAIALYDSAPSVYDKNNIEYYKIEDNLYLEMMRVSVADTASDDEYRISDKEWQYIKKSFKTN